MPKHCRPVFYCIIIVLSALLSAVPGLCRTIYVDPLGDDLLNTGLSWDSPVRTVQAGINKAATGDEIWVARGTYVELISLKGGVELYGGFAGNETARDQRDWRANPTILDGNKAGTVVTLSAGSLANTVIDGFVIRNGKGTNGGGVDCAFSYPLTISNNVITANFATYGGGINSYGYAPKIVNNIIDLNIASQGGGIYCYAASTRAPVISGNVITRNRAGSAGGVYAACSPILTNNTIAGNSSWGILCLSNATRPIANNIVAFNENGICVTTTTLPELRSNCVYNPGGKNYSGIAAGVGDISCDPMFAGLRYGNAHIQPGSPCRETGWADSPELGGVDIDGQARVQPADGNVDIGADESNGATWTLSVPVIRVSPDGDDANDGESWTSAKKTVQAAIDTVALVNGEVWVAKGTYPERITLKDNAYVYGGFAGTETTRDQRNPKANETILDGGAAGSVVTATDIGYRTAAIDGFTIRNGSATNGGGIVCGNAYPLICNNKITANTAAKGGGVYFYSTNPLFAGNTITANTATNSGGGIYCSYASLRIVRNTITANSAANYGGAIVCENSSPTLTSNVLSVNTAPYGSCIYSPTSSSPVLTNNTITGHKGDVFYFHSYSVELTNNIIAFNSENLHGSSGTNSRNNCLYNPDSGSLGSDLGTGDICADPRIANWQCGDFHIQPDSPCINAGSNDASAIDDQDIDNQARLLPAGGVVDIGADESDGTLWTVPAATVRVSPDGDDANDGSSWTAAKKTVQAGMDAAAAIGGEVWVKAGTYYERLIPNSTITGVNGFKTYMSIYGGFAGTETTRDQRDCKTNPTILDGSAGGSVVTTANGGCGIAAIDGFTIRNGKADNGGGISCSSGTIISNNAIVDNTAVYEGGGIYCRPESTANIARNRMLRNIASRGSAVYIWNCSPKLYNNLIAESKSDTGAVHCEGTCSSRVFGNVFACNPGTGLYFGYATAPSVTNNTFVANSCAIAGNAHEATTIANNLLAYNRYGIQAMGLAFNTPALRNNCVYTRDGYDHSYTSQGITVDPRISDDWRYGDYTIHLQPDSPCKDAGWNGAAGIEATDIDGQQRIMPSGGAVDIGADECDGTMWSYTPAVVRVSVGGDDANDGLSWDKAKRTVQAGINALAAGGEVWVAKGVYTEHVALRQYVHVYGGFAGTETGRDLRDWRFNETVLDGGGDGTVVSAANIGNRLSTIDGFTIRNGKGTEGAGISCSRASLLISHNNIKHNDGAGIYCYYSSPVIASNTISGNTNASGPGAIYCYRYSSALVINNLITGNTSAPRNGAVHFSYYSSATLVSNTIAGNIGLGFYNEGGQLFNNILAFNSLGVIVGDVSTISSNNCVYNPGAGDRPPFQYWCYRIVDPQFVSPSTGNYHLRPTSPCINSGQYGPDWIPQPQDCDMDGQKRIQGGTVDMGADEWWPGAGDAKKIADGGQIGLSAAIVTAAFPDFFYVESDDRSGGIRVDKAGHSISAGARVDVDGTPSTNSAGEAYIAASSVQPTGKGSLAPIMLTNKSLGGGQTGLQSAVWNWLTTRQPDNTLLRTQTEGFGLNNIGLLIKTTGKVTYATDGYFYIDDGSGLDDNSGHKGVKVYGRVVVDAGVDPVNKNVTVIGISSCEKLGADPVRVIRTRGEYDVSVMAN